MSIEMMNSAWNTDDLTPTKKLILLLLGSYADENHQCYPSHKHIAKKIGLKDTKGIQKTIKEFEQLGYLRIERRTKQNGAYTSNKYTLTLPLGVSTHRGNKRVREGAETPVNTKEETKTFIYTDEFETFWDLYPRKVAKKNAYKFFKKVPAKDYDLLIASIKNLGKSKIDIKYIPYPATWLNQERWKDKFEDIKEDQTNKSTSNWHDDLDI
tara:strand:- start:1704 stop:2336 length:633 start_codon:yes stop_codon:yes gene_type:complete